MAADVYYDIALELLGEPFGRLLAQPGLQEVSANYDTATSTCRVFVNRGAGTMLAAGIALDARRG